jgi:5'-3' exonuclease
VANPVVLVDLSSIAHPIWHMSQAEPDANATCQRIVARIRAIGAQQPHVAICCDSGKSFRHDIAASYKANRPEHEAPLHHQIDLAKEQLAADGYPVWAVRGFEADDVIAAAALQAELADLDVLVVSADKDLLQLVGPRVKAMNAKTGDVLDEAAVVAKFGVKPEQVRDYLTLVGDSADNIKGAKGIGPKKAADLLTKYGTLDALYQALDEAQGKSIGLQVSTEMALREFREHMPTARELVTLRTDVELPFADVTAERVPKDNPVLNFAVEDEMDDQPIDPPAGPTAVDATEPAGQEPSTASTGLSLREPDAVMPAPTEWERGLDPRSMKDARLLAKDMHESRMFSAYGTPQGVLATIMVGRELGLPAMASLRSVHVIEGKHSLSASLMVALVLKSGLAEFFEPVSFSETEATYETKRKGARNPIRLTHTFDMATKAWPKEKVDWQKRFEASGWGRNPTDMLDRARAGAAGPHGVPRSPGGALHAGRTGGDS